MPDKETPAKEELLKDRTMLRKLGNVWGYTLPASIMKNQTVQNNKGKQGTIRLVRQGRKLFVEIPLQVTFDGRILEVKKVQKK